MVRDKRAGGTPVRDLQTALKAVGVLDDSPDGNFGKHTKLAISRFKWNLANLKYRLVNRLLQSKVPDASVPARQGLCRRGGRGCAAAVLLSVAQAARREIN